MGQVRRVIALAASGGNPVVIRCTRVTTRMEITEDVATNAAQQGLIANDLTSNGADTLASYTVGPAYSVPPDQEPLIFAGYKGDHPPNAVPIGTGGSSPNPVGPGGPVTHGTPIVQLTSGGTAVSVVVTEWF